MLPQQLSNMVYVQNDADLSRRPVKPGERADQLPQGHILIYAGPSQSARLAAVRDAFGPVSTVQYTVAGLRFTSVEWQDAEPEGETPYLCTWTLDIGIYGTEHDPDGEFAGDPEEPRKRGEAKISVLDLHRCTQEQQATPALALDIDGSLDRYAPMFDPRHCRLRDDLGDLMLGSFTQASPCIETLIQISDLQLHWPCRSAGLGREVITRVVRTLRPNGYVLVAAPVRPIQTWDDSTQRPSKHPTRNPYRLDMLTADAEQARACITARYETAGWTVIDGVLYRLYHDGNPVDKNG